MTLPPRPNDQGHELLRRVEEATQGTPYAVQETDRGFDVTLDVVDAQWYGLFNKAGLEKVYVHHVSFPEPGAYAITDDARTLEWVAGTPRVGASVARTVGRVHEFGGRKIVAFDDQGELGVQADYRFSSEEGRRLITGAAEQLGLEQRRGAAERTGLVFAVGAGVLAVLVVVVNLVLWLTGYYG